MTEAQPFSSVARLVVERAIAKCDEGPAERKRRVQYVRDRGIFTDQEAADWLAIYEVQAA